MERDKFSILVSNPLDNEYIQKLAFKAGYKWGAGRGTQVIRTEQQQLAFHEKDKALFCHSKGRFLRPEDDMLEYYKIYSFPESAAEIHKIFATPEYKVGDYVVLVDTNLWSMALEKTKGSTQRIQSIFEDGKISKITFKEKSLKHWNFDLKDIARHATEKEIKVYKEGDDIYIGKYPIKFNGGVIEVGCAQFCQKEITALIEVFKNSKYHGGSFLINKYGITFSEKEGTAISSSDYYVSEEVLNKIIKRMEKE